MGDKIEKDIASLLDTLRGTGAVKKKEKAASRLVDMSCDVGERTVLCKKPEVLDTLVQILKSPVKGTMGLKEKAAAAVGNLSLEPRNAGIIASHNDMIKALVSVFYTDGSQVAKENVARALGNMGNGNESVLSKISTTVGAVQAIVELTNVGSPGEREQACALLWDMAQAEIVGPAVPNLLEGLVGTMIDGNDAAKENASAALCSICEIDPGENATVFTTAGFVSAVCSLLRSRLVEVQEHVAELVWTILSNGCVTQVAESQELVDTMIWLLNEDEPEAAIESTVAAFRTLTAVNKDVCATFAQSDGTVDRLTFLIKTVPNVAIREDGIGILWNIAYHIRIRKHIAEANGLLDAFEVVLTEEEEEHGPLENIAGAMRMLTAGNDESLQIVSTDTKALDILSKVLAKRVSSPMEDASAAIWNICNAMPDKMLACKTPGLLHGLVDVCNHGTDAAKQNASGAIGTLALNQETSEDIAAEQGCVTALVKLLSNELQSCKEHAAAAIGNLAMDSEKNMIVIAREPGALEGLVNVIKFGSDAAKENAVAALGNLALNPDNMALIAKPGAMSALETLINNGSERAKENAALTLGNLVLNSDDNARLLVETPNLLQGLVKAMVDGSVHAQENAALAISHVAAHAEDESLLLSLHETLDNLSSLIEKGSDVAKEDATAAIGNLALRGDENREKIGSHPRALDGLVKLMQTGTAEAIENACLALGNLSLIEANEKRIMQKNSVVDNLVNVLEDSTDLAKDAACKIIANLVASNTDNRAIMLEKPKLIPSIYSCIHVPSCRVSATAALLNMTGSEDGLAKLSSISDVKTTLESISNGGGNESKHAQVILQKLETGVATTQATVMQELFDNEPQLARRASQAMSNDVGSAAEPAAPPVAQSPAKMSARMGGAVSGAGSAHKDPGLPPLGNLDLKNRLPKGLPADAPLQSPLALDMAALKSGERRGDVGFKPRSTTSERKTARSDRNTARQQRVPRANTISSDQLV